MDQKRFEEIKKANRRLAEANSRVEVLKTAEDIKDLRVIFEDAYWPQHVKEDVLKAVTSVLSRYASQDQAEALAAWEAL